MQEQIIYNGEHLWAGTVGNFFIILSFVASILAALSYFFGLHRLLPENPSVGRYLLTHLPIDRASPVDAVSGCCLLARREAETAQQDATAALNHLLGHSTGTIQIQNLRILERSAAGNEAEGGKGLLKMNAHRSGCEAARVSMR